MTNELTPLTRWLNYRQIIDCFQLHRSESILVRRFNLSYAEAVAIVNVIYALETKINE